MPAPASFTTTMTVERTRDDVFAAIKRPRDWWSTAIAGAAEQVGDEFAFDSPGHHCWRLQVTELLAPRRIVWRVLDTSSTDFAADIAEWNGTEVHFELTSRDNLTEVRFTHVGLVPELECFDACSAGWTGYLQRSLPALLATGHGQPGAY